MRPCKHCFLNSYVLNDVTKKNRATKERHRNKLASSGSFAHLKTTKCQSCFFASKNYALIHIPANETSGPFVTSVAQACDSVAQRLHRDV